MSDFIYSKKNVEHGKLAKEIQRIYSEDKPQVQEFHEDWGSLAVSSNIYNGFQPYETNDFIFLLMGGPVLYFRDNEFINSNAKDVSGTKAVFNRWIEGEINWHEDLSGPFAILIIDKNTFEVQCITDLMSFIPIYIYQDKDNIFLSTHVDVLANTTNQTNNIDLVSYADFILHSVITFPYTAYKKIFQITPASIHIIKNEASQVKSQPYWIPEEKYNYNSIHQASKAVRRSLVGYVSKVKNEVSNVAQFISGGEDSRILSGLLQGVSRDAFIFLDEMNREGKVAKKAALKYGATFNMGTRTKTHYIKILPLCSNLVGSGSQYHHAHTFGFHKKCNLYEYDAVFGGLFSDALLKGARIKKIRGSGRLSFLPDIKEKSYSPNKPIQSKLFASEILKELTIRRQSHYNYVKSFRHNSAKEWFELWPSSMNFNIPNLHANRRLFRSYEPFMANDIVKISASVSQNWKLNRKLFHKATKSLLKPTKWLLHGDGRLPYYPWYINSIVQFFFWFNRQIGEKTGLIKGNQGPWGEWKVVMESDEWFQALDDYSTGFGRISEGFIEQEVNKLFKDGSLSTMQQINLLQVLYENSSKRYK